MLIFEILLPICGLMGHAGMDHEMGKLSTGESVTIVIGTFIILLFAVGFTSHFIAPIVFTG